MLDYHTEQLQNQQIYDETEKYFSRYHSLNGTQITPCNIRQRYKGKYALEIQGLSLSPPKQLKLNKLTDEALIHLGYKQNLQPRTKTIHYKGFHATFTMDTFCKFTLKTYTPYTVHKVIDGELIDMKKIINTSLMKIPHRKGSLKTYSPKAHFATARYFSSYFAPGVTLHINSNDYTEITFKDI